MRNAQWCVLVLVLSPIAFGQQTVTKDPTAMAIVQQSLVAMGSGQNFVDVQASGTTTAYGDAGSLTQSVTLQATGAANIRTTITKPSGATRIYGTDGLAACIDGAPAEYTADLTVEGIYFVPALSILNAYAQPDTQVQYQGTDQIGSSIVDIVALTFTQPGAPASGAYASTQLSFFIDRATAFVLKIKSASIADASTSNGPTLEIVLSQYQIFSGFAVPLDQTTSVGGVLDHELMLTSVAFNTGLDSSLFAMTCEVPNAQ
jgi:hypothetical protein